MLTKMQVEWISDVFSSYQDDRRLGDGGMRVEDLLHLARVDVEAAADDEVLLALDDVEEVVGVEAADVAGVQPAVAQRPRGLLREPVVAAHDVQIGRAACRGA